MSPLSDVVVLVNQGQFPEAIKQLRQSEPRRLAWTSQEFYSTPTVARRNKIVSNQLNFQDIVLTLATQHSDREILTLAVDVMLRWKQLQGEEEAYLARLVRSKKNPEIRALGQQVAMLRSQLTTLAQRDVAHSEKLVLLEQLEIRELQLARQSRIYKRHLEVSRAGFLQVQAILPSNTALIEFRQYQPFNFKTGVHSDPEWAAILIYGFEKPVIKNVGSVEKTATLLSNLLGDRPDLTEHAALTLYTQLFAVFGEALSRIQTLYIAADGLLNLIPFEQLKVDTDRYWGESRILRFIYSGRDLLPDANGSPRGQGLLALGGIDFGHLTAAGSKVSNLSGDSDVNGSRNLDRAIEATRSQLGGFPQLSASKQEVQYVKVAFETYLPKEPVHIWSDEYATEHRLKTLDNGKIAPPRILHLATHGFYLSQTHSLPKAQWVHRDIHYFLTLSPLAV